MLCFITLDQTLRDNHNRVLNFLFFATYFVYPHRGGRGGGRFGGRGSFSHHSGGGGSSEPVPEGTQLFVGNIPFETNWRELKDHFSTVGEVQRVFVKTSESGRSKGFATVRFAKKEDAEKAINNLNGVDFQGRDLDVRLDNKV